MFNPNVTDVRNFFFDTYAKVQNKQALNDLEKIAYSIMIEHPEYNVILANKEKYLNYNWLPESGETNPFLHMSMHISIIEQLSINQPLGIKELYSQLSEQFDDQKEVQHKMMDCLAEMIWQAQYTNSQPDPEIYLNSLRKFIK